MREHRIGCHPLHVSGVACLLLTLTSSICIAGETVRVGSKVFTESVILGEIATQFGRSAGVDTLHRSQLGGTRVLWEALLGGEIDAYPEYSGTIVQELLSGQSIRDDDQMKLALAAHGIGVTRTLGFNDTYAIGMPEALAAQLGITTISDLRSHSQLHFGFSNEFLDRKDGWPALRSAYDLPQSNVIGLDHDLAYRAIESGKTDVIDLYSTDAEIAFYHLRVLQDDHRLFPEYDAVYLYRLDLDQRAPAFVSVLHRLEGAIDARQMTAMNAQCKIDKVAESKVASEFLFTTFKTRTDARESSELRVLLVCTREHLLLVGVSLTASILIAIPLGSWHSFGRIWGNSSSRLSP